MYINLNDLKLTPYDPDVVQTLVPLLAYALQTTNQSDFEGLATLLNQLVESVSESPHHSLDCEQLEVLRSYCTSIAGPLPS